MRVLGESAGVAHPEKVAAVSRPVASSPTDLRIISFVAAVLGLVGFAYVFRNSGQFGNRRDCQETAYEIRHDKLRDRQIRCINVEGIQDQPRTDAK